MPLIKGRTQCLRRTTKGDKEVLIKKIENELKEFNIIEYKTFF